MSTIDLVVQTGPVVELDISTTPGVDLELTMPGASGEVEDARIGDLANLTTEAKNTVVAAINELNYEDISLVLFYENAKAG